MFKHLDTNTCSIYTVILRKETHHSRREVSKAYTLNDRQVQTIVRTIMPDIYLYQNYRDSYVCECPEDLEAAYGPAGDEDSSEAAATPGADYSA